MEWDDPSYFDMNALLSQTWKPLYFRAYEDRQFFVHEIAAAHNSVNVMAWLTNYGLTLDVIQHDDYSTLELAVDNGSLDTLRFFGTMGLHGIHLCRDEYYIQSAAKSGNVDMFLFFRDCGLTVDQVREGDALTYAAARGHLSLCQFLKTWSYAPTTSSDPRTRLTHKDIDMSVIMKKMSKVIKRHPRKTCRLLGVCQILYQWIQEESGDD
jgi:hypothetical protein